MARTKRSADDESSTKRAKKRARAVAEPDIAPSARPGLSLTDFETLIQRQNDRRATVYAQVLLPQYSVSSDRGAAQKEQLDALVEQVLMQREQAEMERRKRKGKAREIGDDDDNDEDGDDDADMDTQVEDAVPQPPSKADKQKIKQRMYLRLVASETILRSVYEVAGIKHMWVCGTSLRRST